MSEWTEIPETRETRDLNLEFPGAAVRDSLLEHQTAATLRGSAERGRVSSLPETLRKTCERVCDAVREHQSSARVIAVVGPTGSGKTVCLRALSSCDKIVTSCETPTWNPKKAVVSQFGSPNAARQWLGRVGLNSVPSWTRPYHILSTGEKFRADLARRLQSATGMEEDAASGPRVVLIDNFTSTLDRRTAACCSTSIAKQWRALAEHSTLVVFTPHSDVLPWLQPNLVIELSSSKSVRAICENQNGGTLPRVHTIVDLNKCVVDFECASTQGVQRTLSLWTPPVLSTDDATATLGGGVHSASHVIYVHENTLESFRYDDQQEKRPHGGTVLRTEVVLDECTQMCDSLFDSTFDGCNIAHVPTFPDDNVLGPEWTLGYVTGPSGSLKSIITAVTYGACMLNAINPWNMKTTRASATVRDGLIAAIAQSTKDDSFESELIELARYLDVEPLLDVSVFTLSTGERFVVDLCVLLLSNLTSGGKPLVVDEFTSYLDRHRAARVCRGLSRWLVTWNRAARASDHHGDPIRLILVGCHDDVVPFLRPHWSYDTSTHMVVRFTVDALSSKQDVKDDDTSGHPISSSFYSQRASSPQSMPIPVPIITLRIVPCVPALWKKFRRHHYKTKKLSKAATTYVALATCTIGHATTDDESCVGCRKEPVAMVSTIRHNGPRSAAGGVRPSRAHRTVVLPTWQGLGIGSHVSDAAGEIRTTGMKSEYFGQTVHPAFGSYRDRSVLWVPTKFNHTIQEFKIGTWKQRKKKIRIKLNVPKFIYSHRYVGDAASITDQDFADESTKEDDDSFLDSNDQGGRRKNVLQLDRRRDERSLSEQKERAAWKASRMTIIPLR